ncbi:hypothetical protein [Clostridium sp.]|uniref:hypothetical protein n=1 Tax=Clostridium sp. TaxID=1506 RepID=UPI003D6C791A
MAKNKNEYLNHQRAKVEKSNMLENTIEQMEKLVPILIRTDYLYDEKADQNSKKR